MRQLLSLLAFALIASPLRADDSLSKAWKTIELEWESVDKAKGYEVRLTPADGSKPRVFQTDDNRLTQEVPVGNYKLQIRARSMETDEYSKWSPASELEVAVKEVTPLYPADQAVIDAKSKSKQPVEFKWTPVDKVRVYTLKVWSEDKKDAPWIFTGHGTARKLEVPPGRVYYWQVLFESASETSYQQEPKTFSFTLQGTQLLQPTIDPFKPGKELTWKGDDETDAYRVKLFSRFIDDEKWMLLKEVTTEEPKLALGPLKARDYKVEITATASRRLDSASAVYEFLIKPSAQELARKLESAVH